MTTSAASTVPDTSADSPSLPGDTVADAAAAMLAMFGDEDEDDAPPAPAPRTEGEDADEAQSDDAPSQDADDEPASDDADQPPEPPAEDDGLHTVTVDGEEVTVPYDELVRGYSRQADYTRKTQAVAAKEKEIAAVRAQYDAKLAAVEELLAGHAQEPDWADLRERSTPEEFADTYAQWSIQKANREKVQAERARLRAEREAEQQQEVQALAQREAELLLQKMPTWKDAAVRTADMGKLVQYAQSSLNVSAQELAGIVDHRVILALHKAMRYDEMTAKAKTAKSAPVAAPRSVKPSVPRTAPTAPETTSKRQREELLARQRRSGSIQDTAAVFFDMLPD